MFILAITLVTTILTLYYYYTRKWKNALPGPIGYPLIGSLHLLDPIMPYITLTNLAKKYGRIYGIQMGSIYAVVISSDLLIREALKSEQFIGRAPLFVTHGIMGGYGGLYPKYVLPLNHSLIEHRNGHLSVYMFAQTSNFLGLICAEGELWKDQRKLSIKMLKDMGMIKFGKKRLEFESRILKWVLECVKMLSTKSERNAEIDPLDILHHTLGNVMNDLVFGVTYDNDDETWSYLRHLQEEGVKHIGVSGVVNFIPWLRFLPSNQKILNFLLNGKGKTHEIYDKIIKRYESKSQDATLPSVAELFLDEKNRRIQDKDESIKHCTNSQLKHLLADLFGAGVDTTLTTLRWFLWFVADNQKVQDKIRSEFSENLSSQPTLESFERLPYLRACIAEVQRIRSVVPIGYFIPKNAMIIPLQWAVHMDPDIWQDPYKYKPERFLDADGQFSTSSAFIPFQTGKRMCLGEELAKMLLFLFCSNILYQFKLSYADLQPVENILGDCGITLTPPRHKIIFKKID